MMDLCPEDSWNFVFGDASLNKGHAGMLKNKPKQGDDSTFDGHHTPPIHSSLLLRSCKTMTHEIRHMFGIKHYQWLSCVMQCSNHLEESDRRPLDLICLRKLQTL
ncbi:archaemetzincin-2 [Nerophis lumbriciformis]|uniref:archaemetzincin-2 n=1 Tax=Nerophis lumbriciformis TaxID=546530 RepID=UPI002AE05576|nr:archaemetzincin-2-like [Nerophis lumbriciformis]